MDPARSHHSGFYLFPSQALTVQNYIRLFQAPISIIIVLARKENQNSSVRIISAYDLTTPARFCVFHNAHSDSCGVWHSLFFNVGSVTAATVQRNS